jgi:ankyrin repeat protein
VFCQLETLRHCLPPSVHHTLDELPESLDETYERVLKEIKKPNRDHARRLLQCLVVAIRPLEVEELAEVLAVDFGDAEGIPKLNPDWRWEDEEQALLTSCSSLIAIVETDDSRVVQFSHFSVKEFLTSTRLADSRKDLSRYHIDLEPAHTVLAQACMGVLLQPDNRVEDNRIWSFSLAGYAAEYWVKHAQFKGVSSSLQKPMEYLFDSDTPHFATWLELHNIDIRPSRSMDSSLRALAASSPSASPLYYAALCGFQDLVEHLVIKHPQHVYTNGGWYGTPLVAALAGRHFQTAKFLHDNGAHLDVHYEGNDTPLHSAAYYGDVEMVQVLLGYGVDVNAQDRGWTPLHDAASNGSRHLRIPNIVQSSRDVTRILLEHGADVNARRNDNTTSLHDAARNENAEVIPVLLEHGANVGAEDEQGRTPLHEATRNRNVEVVRMLLEHNADVNARAKDGSTPLLKAAENGSVEVVQMLIKHGANVCAEDEEGKTPLHEATRNGNVELVRMLLEHSADVNARTKHGSTPLLMAAESGSVEVVRMLIEHGANADVKDEGGRTPLHGATGNGSVELVRMLLEHGADVNAQTNDRSTALLMAAQYGNIEIVRTLLEHGVNVEAEDKRGRTSFQIASVKGYNDILELLSDYGAKGVFSVSTSSLCLL